MRDASAGRGAGDGALPGRARRRRAGRDLDALPFEDWFARHAPRLHTVRKELAEVYKYRWFVVYRNLRRPFLWFTDHPMPGELFFEGPVSNWFTAPVGLSFPLQLREARWMRSPRGVQDTLNAWTANAGALRSYAADPLTPAIEFAEHHPLKLGAARDAALDYVLGKGRSARLEGGDLHSFPVTVGSWVTGTEYAPDFFAEVGWDHTRSEMFMPGPRCRARASPTARRRPLTRVSRVDTDVWHWAMVKALGGPDLAPSWCARTCTTASSAASAAGPIKSVLNFEAALPFLYADFGPRERAALARAIDAWTAPKGLYSTAPGLPRVLARQQVPRLPLPVLLERAGLELRHLVGPARARRRRLAHQGARAARPLRARVDAMDRLAPRARGAAGRRALPPRDRPSVSPDPGLLPLRVAGHVLPPRRDGPARRHRPAAGRGRAVEGEEVTIERGVPGAPG